MSLRHRSKRAPSRGNPGPPAATSGSAGWRKRPQHPPARPPASALTQAIPPSRVTCPAAGSARRACSAPRLVRMRVRSLSPGPKKVRGKNGPMVCGEVGGSGAFGRCGGTRRSSVMAWPAWRRGRAARCHARNPASRPRLPRAAAAGPPGDRALPASGIDIRIRSSGLSGSPGKYICVTSRASEAGPSTEKWTCGGRHQVFAYRHRIGAGLDGEEAVAAVVIRQHAAIADEIGVERRVALIVRVEVAAGGIGLPEFHHGAAYRPAVLVQHPAADMDELARCAMRPGPCSARLSSPQGSLRRARAARSLRCASPAAAVAAGPGYASRYWIALDRHRGSMPGGHGSKWSGRRCAVMVLLPPGRAWRHGIAGPRSQQAVMPPMPGKPQLRAGLLICRRSPDRLAATGAGRAHQWPNGEASGTGRSRIGYLATGRWPDHAAARPPSAAAPRISPRSPPFAAAGFRVLRPEPRGIGHSIGPMDGLTLYDLAEDAAAALVAEAGEAPVQPAVVAGHAFGNWVARALSAARPESGTGGGAPGGFGRHRDLDPAIRASIDGSFDPALSDAERLRHLQRGYFARGHDARVWLAGWHPPWRGCNGRRPRRPDQAGAVSRIGTGALPCRGGGYHRPTADPGSASRGAGRAGRADRHPAMPGMRCCRNSRRRRRRR